MNALRFATLTAALVLAVAVSGFAPAAKANGVPQLVKLTYLEGVSNWGPKEAEGVLEFSFAEAYARVDVKNLKPAEGFTYEGWMTGGAGTPLLVGKITVQSSGVGLLDTKLTSLKRYDYDTFVIAARPTSSHDTALPAERSIAGRFTVLADTAGGAAAGDVRPAQLPDTGEAPESQTRERVTRTAFTVLAAGGLAVVFLRTRKRWRSND